MGISKKAWLSVGAETTPGNAVAGTLYIPAKSDLKFVRAKAYLDEDRGTRDEQYGVAYGPRHAELSVKSAFYYDTDPYFIQSAMGSDTASQPQPVSLPSCWKHTFGWLDSPKTLTIYQNYDITAYQAAYGCVKKMDFKAQSEGKTLDFSTDLCALFPVAQAGGVPTFSGNRPSAGYNGTLTLNGASTTDILELEVSYEQAVTLFTPINGSPDFVKAYFGKRKASVSFTARFDSQTYFNKWLNVTNSSTDSLVIDYIGDLIGTVSGTNYYNELNINIGTFVYDDMEPDKSKDNVLVKVKGTVIPTGSTGLFTCYVQNTVSSYAT